jgi:molybdenum cofactor cytidylyltransferase|tara:strand:+ start:38 stop:643 length:606 start_codon:yes stop_codon:yes gene_type:complete
MSDIPLILLAAGKSKRMGVLKQLLPWQKNTLLENCLASGLEFKSQEIFVIVGSNKEKIIPIINHTPVNIIINEKWSNGIGSSIAKGVSVLLKLKKKRKGVFIYLADQPFVGVDLIEQYYNAFDLGKKGIVATRYNKRKIGVPALFDVTYFDELSKLSEDFGAQKIIEKYKHNSIVIEPEKKLLKDIDTPSAYHKYFNKLKV